MQKFFVVCQPGFEEELTREIQEFWPFLIDADARPNATPFQVMETSVGGVLIEAPLILGLQINFFSRLASRVLLRVNEFRVRDFPKLHERFCRVDLAPFFGKDPFRVDVAASKSRLNNEKRIYEICKGIWPAISEEAPAALLIRMHDDVCTLSVDTSGDHLHLRTASKWVGEAPLRETVAAFMLRCLIGPRSQAELREVHLWDPMAGSGTLPGEGKHIFQPHFHRKFTFQKFASCPKILKLEGLSLNYAFFSSSFASISASDQNPKMLEVLKHNLAGDSERIFLADFFELNDIAPSVPKAERLWFVLNPPYGERLAMQKSFVELGRSLVKFNPERIGILTPRGFSERVAAGLSGFALENQHFFKNGGIPVEFSVFAKISGQ
jgi:putative N6-adenine-specific DNA methylase